MPDLLFGRGAVRKVPVEIIAPHPNSTKPMVIILPSSTPDMRSEEYIAKELRKNGYNTAVVYSYGGIDSFEKFSSKLTSSAMTADLIETARELEFLGFGINGYMGIGTSRGAMSVMKAGLEPFRDMYHGAKLITHGVALNGPCYERLDKLKVSWDFSLLIANGEKDDSTPIAPCKKMVSMLDENVKHIYSPEWMASFLYSRTVYEKIL